MSIPAMLSANERNISESTVQDAEGNTYRTVQIGNQTWFAENLRSTRFRDGSKIPTAFIPNDEEENLLKYGRLYDWRDVSDERNICPVGWRVATDVDWKELEKTIGMAEEDIDKKGWRGDGLAITLKEVQPDTMFSKFDQSQVNKFKFSVRPAGIKWKRWYFVQGMYTEFWTASEATEAKAYNRTFAHSCWNWHKGKIYRSTLSKDYMFSVRCIKD
ncbi:fibrobacter succinogenes major paralogous domain-containing protein [Desulfovibrio sp. JC022]|uniref:fibrobacter succinogenes major paralogous domain-containing protein n=1 Tax=Desulfovibrio sp. JC022 TaxID=2593642 RepID=UPI00193F84D4|nr:fibrobacter succinogenes major paralogous domain-containing protein [Desulfovibrio sp. JC022]